MCKLLLRIFVVAVALYSFTSIAFAQHAKRVNVVSPRAGEIVCMGSSVPIELSAINGDTVARDLLISVTIRNIGTGIVVYQKLDTVPMAPGMIQYPVFPNFTTSPNILSELGTFSVCAKISAFDSAGVEISGWPFADSVCGSLFDIRRSAGPFRDAFDNPTLAATGTIPNQTQWLSYGATVENGDSETWDPPQPRDIVSGSGQVALSSPVIRLDTRDVSGNSYNGATRIGDTLESFPINFELQRNVLLAFDFQRGQKQRYPGLWDENVLSGPEQTITDAQQTVLRAGDSLYLEFRDPENAPCDSAATWRTILGIDGGHDLEFRSAFLHLTDSNVTVKLSGLATRVIALDRNYLDTNFQFRFRLAAKNDSLAGARDDDDPWFIDNVNVSVRDHPELEVLWARVVTPYTVLPYSAAAAMPVYTRVRNYGDAAAPVASVRVRIVDSTGRIFYDRAVDLPGLLEGEDTVIRLPDWNAQPASFRGPYFVTGVLSPEGHDSYAADDSNYSTFYLNVGGENTLNVFAYDDAGIAPAAGGGNDIPAIISSQGAGIGFRQTTGSYAVKYTLPARDTVTGVMIYFANANQSPDNIRIDLLTDAGSCVPGPQYFDGGVAVSFPDVRRGGYFNQFWPFYFPRPAVLEPGAYWISVSQLDTESFDMGADISRSGGALYVADSSPVIAPIYSDPYGTQYSPDNNNGSIACTFAIATPAGSGAWRPWLPDAGYWATSSTSGMNQEITLDPIITAT